MTGLSVESARRLGGMGKVEFIALMALLMALNALAIDIMLPGLQEIGASLGVTNENHRQYVISAYLIGFALAQLAYGPLSDRFGRRTPMFVGLGIYIASSLLAVMVPSFGALLALRFIQGGSHVADHDGLHGRAGAGAGHWPDGDDLRRLAPDLHLHGDHGGLRRKLDVCPPA